MYMNRLIKDFLSIETSYYSYSVLRSVLAFSLLLTVVFNDFHIIYLNEKINIFNLISINVQVYKYISIVILLMTISGFIPRITGILHFIITFTFFKTCPFVDGGDQLASNITFFLIPMTLFDKNLTHWKNTKNPFTGLFSKPFFLFSTLIICIQISVVYLHSSIDKLKVSEWQDGTAIWYWFTHESFGASYFILDFLKYCLRNPFIIYSVNWFVIIIELLTAMMLFVPKDKLLPKLLFYICISIHFGVILIHGIFTFSIVMIGCLLFYFQINPKKIWRFNS